jgi:hypothetical protein
MDFQRHTTNDLFYGMGIEFYEGPFTDTIVYTAAHQIQEYFLLKNIQPHQSLQRKTLAWMYLRKHHLLSLIKKPDKIIQLFFNLNSLLYGYRI